MSGRTVLVLGDQLNRTTGALARADAGTDRVVLVESLSKLRRRPWHRAKLQLVWSAMRHFADELRAAGFDVDYRQAATLQAGLAEYDPGRLVAMAPSSAALRGTLTDWGVEQVTNEAFIVGEQRFAAWADDRKRLRLDGFYRMVRREHGWLMSGDQPVGGRWSFDADNREPPPRDARVEAPTPYRPREDDVDARVRDDLRRLEDKLGLRLYGRNEGRLFPATRAEAKRSLRAFLERRLDGFGPLEDAVVDGEPFLWHSLLSAPLNLGLLHPREVADEVDRRYGERGGPLNSYEGFLRQLCGWREYVWGLYWYRRRHWDEDNALDHHGEVPDFFWDGDTDLRCVARTVQDVLERGWVHHIPRLMILGNFALLAGVNPQRLSDWFSALFVDAYDWVMQPNVVGMSQWADGGVMATKPYAASARYLDRMTTYCGACRYDPTTRGAEDSCPFNSLYWDFLSRHRETLSGNPRMQPLYSTLDRFDASEGRRIHDGARPWRTDCS